MNTLGEIAQMKRTDGMVGLCQIIPFHKRGKKEILEMEVVGTRKLKRADLKAVKHTN